jgi:glycosyltransferase involved in cell wall biosynthesis
VNRESNEGIKIQGEYGNRPRVLFLDQTSELGGAELSLLSLMRGRGIAARDRVVLFGHGPLAEILAQDGFDVVVASLAESAADVKKASGLVEQLGAMRGTQQQVHRVRRLAENMDVVYANTAKALVVAAISFRHRPQPVIYHLRDMITANHFSRANRWVLVTLANRYVTRVIANSQATAEAFVEAGGRRDLVEVIPNGFESGEWEAQATTNLDCGGRNAECEVGGHRQPLQEHAAVRPLYPRPMPRAPVIAVFGRMAVWKGQDVAIRAVAQLPGVELWIVGAALFGEVEYVAKLRQLAEELRVADRVRFLGFRDDVFELMQQTDVVVHTSTVPEPFGRVVVEAMLARRPVVASRGGGVLEIVDDEETGLLAEMGDANALATQLRRLLADPLLATRLAANGARVARERYSIEACIKRTNEVVEKVARGSAQGK